MSMNRTYSSVSVFTTLLLLSTTALSQGNPAPTSPNEVLTSVDTKLLMNAAGPAQRSSLRNIYLIGCNTGQAVAFGTGFLLSSGIIVTNAHVVNGCAGHTLAGVSTSNQQIGFTTTILDQTRDLALLIPSVKLEGGYVLASSDRPEPGTRVDTWGYPFGYNGASPLLSVGYVAGYRDAPSGEKKVKHIVVNGAFNHGNSGGPLLISQETEVVGIVVLTFHFYPAQVRQIIDVMANNSSGIIYGSTLPDGTKKNYAESQLTAAVLDEFYDKTQIDIGEAIAVSELKQFMHEHSTELPADVLKKAPRHSAAPKNH